MKVKLDIKFNEAQKEKIVKALEAGSSLAADTPKRKKKRPKKNAKALPGTFAWYGIVYLMLIPDFRKHGYALAIHGSCQRDLDLIAVPWVKGKVTHPDTVILDIMKRYKLMMCGKPENKPHGRKAFALDTGAGTFVDISFMPIRRK